MISLKIPLNATVLYAVIKELYIITDLLRKTNKSIGTYRLDIIDELSFNKDGISNLVISKKFSLIEQNSRFWLTVNFGNDIDFDFVELFVMVFAELGYTKVSLCQTVESNFVLYSQSSNIEEL